MEQPPLESHSIIEASELSGETLIEQERVFPYLHANQASFGGFEVAQIADYLGIDEARVVRCLQALTEPGHWQYVQRTEGNPSMYRYAALQPKTPD